MVLTVGVIGEVLGAEEGSEVAFGEMHLTNRIHSNSKDVLSVADWITGPVTAHKGTAEGITGAEVDPNTARKAVEVVATSRHLGSLKNNPSFLNKLVDNTMGEADACLMTMMIPVNRDAQ